MCAKAEGQETGLPDDVAALFPDRLVESEVGEIPEGWQVQGLDKIARFLNGLALQNYPANGESSLPVIKIAQLRKGNTEGADQASSDIPTEYIIKDGDVLFSWSGSLEVEIWCGGVGALNQHLFKVSSDQYPKWLYYLWVKHHLASFQQIAADKATTMGHIQRRHLNEAQAYVPHNSLVSAANDLFSPILDRVIANSVESRTLATLRDTLLPKLISGEVRVKDVEKFV